MDTFVKKYTLKFPHIFYLYQNAKKRSNKNVSTLSKTDGLIRCTTYNMAGNLCQQPGDRKRKSPRPQNRYRSEIWGKCTAIFWIKNGAYPYGRTSTTYQKAALS